MKCFASITLAIILSVLTGRAGAAEQKPNIVIFQSHDFGQFLHCYGVKTVQTPNMDKFAEAGVRFARSFSTAPVCSPSRASLFTGRFPHSNGVMGLTHHGWDLNPGEKHLAQFLKEAGYETVCIGNNHETILGEAGAKRCGYSKFLGPDGSAVPGTNAAIKELKRLAAGKQPFFLYMSFKETHRTSDSNRFSFLWPGVKPDKSRGISIPGFMPDTPETRRVVAELQGAMRHVDAQFGRLTKAMHDLGLEKNTLVIVTTDHGIEMPPVNGQRHSKGTLYEPGLQVALILRYAGCQGWSGGVVRNEMISNIDVMPSILELLGIPVPANVQGHSFAPLLEGRPYTPNQEIFGEHYITRDVPVWRSLRTETHKLMALFSVKSPTTLTNAIEKDDFSNLKLFDLAADPQETMNLTCDPRQAALCKELAARLFRHMVQTKDPLLQGSIIEPPDPIKLKQLKIKTTK